jgi:hypothetical protein
MAIKKVAKKAAARPAKADSVKTARKPVASSGKSATAVKEKPVDIQTEAVVPETSAPVSAPSGGAPKPIMLVIFAIVAILVVLEMTVLFKGKMDRQRTFSEVSTFGDRGGAERPEAFHGPLLLKCDAQNRLLMVDTDWKKILAWDVQSGKFLFALDKIAAKQEDFQPADVCADKQGNLFILDRLRQLVFAFSPAGELVSTWTAPAA